MSSVHFCSLGHSHGLWNEGEKPHQQCLLLLQERSHHSHQDPQKSGTLQKWLSATRNTSTLITITPQCLADKNTSPSLQLHLRTLTSNLLTVLFNGPELTTNKVQLYYFNINTIASLTHVAISHCYCVNALTNVY